jgi:uncharacterized protein
MGCDIFSTPSATVILGDGSITNCMRTNPEYILLRAPVKYDTRTEILKETPQEFGGCQGCKYFTACYGGCPSAAIDGDWRNRTYLCPLWKTLFQYFENVLRFVGCFSILPSTSQTEEKGFSHGDHGDFSPSQEHGDIPHGDWSDFEHGDAPHGDSHGDWSNY